MNKPGNPFARANPFRPAVVNQSLIYRKNTSEFKDYDMLQRSATATIKQMKLNNPFERGTLKSLDNIKHWESYINYVVEPMQQPSPPQMPTQRSEVVDNPPEVVMLRLDTFANNLPKMDESSVYKLQPSRSDTMVTSIARQHVQNGVQVVEQVEYECNLYSQQNLDQLVEEVEHNGKVYTFVQIKQY